ncbi:hypothetical protein, partial [Pectobacterium quasiaquaticum]|uniref:hypothetical protein n=1 Tax=Pectobacterium quasiaquaticum TaxID=2774015 RepID=UPI001CF7D25F
TFYGEIMLLIVQKIVTGHSLTKIYDNEVWISIIHIFIELKRNPKLALTFVDIMILCFFSSL